MPFTFCHPAIVLPFYRIKKMSMTGLIAGSMAPDFEYFIRMTNKRIYTHTWSGMLWIDLPLGLLLAFCFHCLVRNPLIQHAPTSFQRRLAAFVQFQWIAHFKKNWLMVILCVLIGIGSHFFWDSFTHNRGYFVKHLPFLGSTISIGALYVETPLLLQVLSSIFGGYIILYALWQLPVDQKLKINHQLKPFWIRVFLLASLIFFARLVCRFPKEIADVGIPAISAFLASLLLVSVLNRRRSTA